MADNLKVNSNTDILEFKRKFNLFVSNYDKGEFDGDFEITGDLKVDGDVEIVGELKGADSQIASAVSSYISEHPFAPEMLEGQDIEPDDISATGKITGAEIVEDMSGYSYTPATATNLTINIVYASAVKNGNKITFVVFGTLTRTGETSFGTLLGAFNIPSAVGTKLVPYSIEGVGNTLDNKQVQAFLNRVSSVSIPTTLFKESDLQLRIYIENLNVAMALNTEYVYRYEVTFLLSDNFISQE